MNRYCWEWFVCATIPNHQIDGGHGPQVGQFTEFLPLFCDQASTTRVEDGLPSLQQPTHRAGPEDRQSMHTDTPKKTTQPLHKRTDGTHTHTPHTLSLNSGCQ